MNTFIFEVNTWPLILSTILRVVASVYFIIVIKKAHMETGVRNGLIALRVQLLVSALILFVITILGLGFLIIRPFMSQSGFTFVTNCLSVLNSFGFLIVAWIQHKIYTQQYTPEQKVLHERISKLEVIRIKLNKDRRSATVKRNKSSIK